MSDTRFLYVTLPYGGQRRSFLDGERYLRLAEKNLSPHGTVEHLVWDPDEPAGRREEALDAILGEVDALIVAPWLGFGNVTVFDAARLRLTPRLQVIAGTFDYRLRWIDLDEADQRGVTVSDTSRTMMPTVAEFGVAITLALLRDIPSKIDVMRSGEWINTANIDSTYVYRDLADCRVGLAGYGSINRHFRRFISGFGCPVSVFDPLLDDAGA